MGAGRVHEQVTVQESSNRSVPGSRSDAGAASAAPESGGPAPSRVQRVLRSSLVRLVGRRLLTAIPVVWGVTFLTFAVLNLLPGDAAQALLGADATPQEVQQLRVELHLNEPFLTRYGHWLGSAVTGHLGSSLGSGQLVTTILAQRLPVTFELIGYAFVISLVIAVPVATLAARRPGGVFDSITTFITMIGLSIAPYILALLLILLFSVDLALFPALGWTPLSGGLGENLRSLTLPALSLGFPIGCFYTRLLRADVVEQLGEDYVVTAVSKGLPSWRVLVRHAVPNSMFGLITVVGAERRNAARRHRHRGADLRPAGRRPGAVPGDPDPRLPGPGRHRRRVRGGGRRHRPAGRPPLRRPRPKDQV